MTYNLNVLDIVIRFSIMLLIGIIGGLSGMYVLMFLAIPIFLSGFLGWCPVYYILGINHHKPEEMW